MAIFPTFFLGNIGQENVIYDILEGKHAFLGYIEKRSSKSRKIDIFSKEVNPWFSPKNGHFSNFFLGNKSLQNVSYDILKQTNAFLRYKN